MAVACGVPHKALVAVAGQSMLYRVVRAVREARMVDRVVVCGLDESALADQPELQSLLAAGEFTLVGRAATPSASVAAALSRGVVAPPLLVTTADHPLLTAAIIDSFCDGATSGGGDVGVGLVPGRLVRSTFPQGQRTFLRFRDDDYCGCNLFAFLTEASRRAPEFWVRIEAFRKQPWRMVGFIGVGAVVRYLAGRLSLQDTLALVSARMGLRVVPVLLTAAAAGFDVDKLSDKVIVEELLRERDPRRSG